MLSDLLPVPEANKKYRKPDGTIIVVTQLVDSDGGIDAEVYYTEEGTAKIAEEADWNGMNLEELPNPSSNGDNSRVNQPTTSNGGTTSTGASSQSNDVNIDDEPTKGSTHTLFPSSSQLSPEPKVAQLEALLEAGPRHFNQEFFPTDKTISDNVLVENDAENAFQKTLDDIDARRENGKNLKGTCGKIYEFLWECAGADRNLLRTCTVDWAKKAGVGGTIFATAVLATLSMTYAAFTVAIIGVNESEIPYLQFFLSLFIGIIWGMVIFNLDRYLVNSMYSDGKSTISWEEIKSGMPRFIIAVFLGIIISTPLEMKLFEGQINEVIISDNLSQKSDTVLFASDPILSNLKEQLNEAKAKANQYFTKYAKGRDNLDKEVVEGQSGRPAGYGKQASALDKIQKTDSVNYYLAKNEVDSLQGLYDSQLKSAIEKKDTDIKGMQGFGKRLNALLEITSMYIKDGNGKEPWFPNNPLFWVRLLIMTFFIVLEIMPTLSKMMQENGQYDKLLDLESLTRERLTRVKEMNNYNILRPGQLSIYRNYIMTGSSKRRVVDDEPNEGNDPYVARDYKKENKESTTQDNQEIYNFARQTCKEYILGRIRAIFNIQEPTQAKASTIAANANEIQDKSAEAVEI